jgi:hypothetical protein
MSRRYLGTLCSVASLTLFVVTDWNINAGLAVKAAGQSPAIQGRFLALVHAANVDPANGIDRRYTPYLVNEVAPGGAPAEAAVAKAAYTALKGLSPVQTATFDAELAESLEKIPGHKGNSQSILRGREWGEAIANQILSFRSLDGFSTPTTWLFRGRGCRTMALFSDRDGRRGDSGRHLPAVGPPRSVRAGKPLAIPSRPPSRADQR